jgi:hypothetical protein
LPGGIGGVQAPTGSLKDRINISELFGFELPPRDVADYLLETYLGAVHWFMMFFHEPTLRMSYEMMMSSQTHPRGRSNQLIFLLLLLSLGAHYVDETKVGEKYPTFDLQRFHARSLKRVEESLNDLYDGANLESVQVCVLLGSYYMYNGRPSLAFVVLGAGVKCAQLMNLHKESAWHWQPEMAKEERRRTFWALFISDR